MGTGFLLGGHFVPPCPPELQKSLPWIGLRSMKHEKESETKTLTRTPSSGILSPNLKGELQPKIIFCPPTNQLERGRWKKSQSVKRTGTGETSSARSQSLEIGAVHTTPGHTSKRVRDVKDSFR